MNCIIGVISRNQQINKKDYVIYNKEIMDTIIRYNCNPLGIIVDNKMKLKDIINMINLCDGIILQGGDYINDIDIQIVKYLYEKDIPTLGICLGMQMMSFGKLKRLQNHNSNLKYVHKIKINKKSKLYSIIKSEQITVNSRHNEHVINTKYDVGAYSEDNKIEEIEDKTKKFYIGVQWHPETLDKDKYSKMLFEKFFDTIKEH